MSQTRTAGAGGPEAKVFRGGLAKLGTISIVGGDLPRPVGRCGLKLYARLCATREWIFVLTSDAFMKKGVFRHCRVSSWAAGA